MTKILHFTLFFLCLRLAGLAQLPLEVKFLAYNLKNYLEDSTATASAAEKKKNALIDIIAAEKPDIVGVCEMGSPAQFQDFLERLRGVGCAYEFTEYVDAMDPDRHIALASRFPIIRRDSQTRLSFELGGKKQYFKRGILDVSVAITDKYELQLIGAHLKSRREVFEDQALLRRGEAHLLRLHARDVLTKNPQAQVLLYGDLNDTINEAPIREIMGGKGAPDYLAPIDLRDSRGEKWTHYWKLADSYTRIDYVMASQSLVKNVIGTKSYIARPPNWYVASDHCPLVVTLKIQP